MPFEIEETDGIIGCLPNVADPIHVQELQNIVNCLPRIFEIPPVNQNAVEISFLKYCRLLHLYQEQPNLLDGLIPKLIDQLIGYVKLLNNDVEFLDDLSREALKYIAELCIVRGRKTIVRLLPHHVSLLEKILKTLEAYPMDKHSDHAQRNILLLWLWIVVRNPFDLRRFDPSGDPNNVISRIMGIAMNYMSWDWNTSQYSASLVIAQCLSRADGIPKIPEILDKLLCDIKEHETNQKLLLADLLLLLAILKHVDRSALVGQLQRIHEKIEFLYPIDESRRGLICKCLVKVAQRLGLIAMKPRKCTWSYRRGKRLLDGLFKENEEKMEVDMNENDDWGNEGDLDNSEIVEWALSHVLSALCNYDTATRWSAAKGVGRITSRLPSAEFASQVVESIIGNHFGEVGVYSSSHSHGGCLALAELARRGVLLPNLLDTVIPVMEKALNFEDPMGIHQNGNQVRDAACYTIWAFARTYEPSVMAPFLQRLSNALICCAIFDREVNLRRAASAAFQETAGRQKNVMNAIDLLTTVDYFAVSNRQRCYEEISVIVARFPAYTRSILEHLVEKKINHWDEKIREQAGVALEKISSINIEGTYDSYYIDIIDKSTGKVNETDQNALSNHSHLLTIGHLVKGLTARNVEIPEKIVQRICGIPINLKPICDRLSHSGALMRKAVCQMMGLFSNARGVHFVEPQLKEAWVERFFTFLKDTNEITRNLAKSAAYSFIRAHLMNEDAIIERLKDSCKKGMSQPADENERIGSCMMSEVIPSDIVGEQLYEDLSRIIQDWKTNFTKWAVARQHSVVALNRITAGMSPEELNEVAPNYFNTLKEAMSDYTISANGDIGRYVREASMIAMTDILVSDKLDEKILDERVLDCANLMIIQSAERIARTRECAARCILRLIENEKTSKRLAHTSILREIYENPQDFILDKTVMSLKRLLEAGYDYYNGIIFGLVLSAGAIGEGTQKTAKQVLLDHQIMVNSDKDRLDRLLNACAVGFTHGQTSIRIATSFLHVLPQILGHLGVYEDNPDNSEHVVQLVEVLKKISAKSTQITRKRLSIEAFAELLNCGKHSKIYREARQCIFDHLSSSVPVLRKAAAEKLYEHLCCAEEIDEEVLELLSTTNWLESNTDFKMTSKMSADPRDKLVSNIYGVIFANSQLQGMSMNSLKKEFTELTGKNLESAVSEFGKSSVESFLECFPNKFVRKGGFWAVKRDEVMDEQLRDMQQSKKRQRRPHARISRGRVLQSIPRVNQQQGYNRSSFSNGYGENPANFRSQYIRGRGGKFGSAFSSVKPNPSGFPFDVVNRPFWKSSNKDNSSRNDDESSYSRDIRRDDESEIRRRLNESNDSFDNNDPRNSPRMYERDDDRYRFHRTRRDYDEYESSSRYEDDRRREEERLREEDRRREEERRSEYVQWNDVRPRSSSYRDVSPENSSYRGSYRETAHVKRENVVQYDDEPLTVSSCNTTMTDDSADSLSKRFGAMPAEPPKQRTTAGNLAREVNAILSGHSGGPMYFDEIIKLLSKTFSKMPKHQKDILMFFKRIEEKCPSFDVDYNKEMISLVRKRSVSPPPETSRSADHDFQNDEIYQVVKKELDVHIADRIAMQDLLRIIRVPPTPHLIEIVATVVCDSRKFELSSLKNLENAIIFRKKGDYHGIVVNPASIEVPDRPLMYSEPTCHRLTRKNFGLPDTAFEVSRVTKITELALPFYVRLKSDLDTFSEMHSAIKSYCSNFCRTRVERFPFSVWKIGHACLVPVTIGDESFPSYRRAVVVKIDNCDTLVVVRLIDFGELRGYDPDKIIPIPEKFTSIPCLAVKLRLELFEVIDDEFEQFHDNYVKTLQAPGKKFTFKPLDWIRGHDEENLLMVKFFIDSHMGTDVLRTLRKEGLITYID
ncbi:unnamed protein product [Caenorhabditis bovis]|uniref:Tubulin-specific chaperone D n=1 Tax=Caenorhabditis bovis TaxID=2654633 RepID=A0A8S1FAC9_9PELO|nr:unnamed protein product [Caenorhabditis bovis]